MSVAMWKFHSWPLDVSSNVKLPFLTTRCQYQCQTASPENSMLPQGGISDSLSGYFISHLIFVTASDKFFMGVYLAAYLGTSSHIWSWSLYLTSCGRYIWQPIWVCHLKYDLGHFIWQIVVVVVWYIWALHLKTWLFWMGSHWQHRSAKNSPSGTGSFFWGVDLPADLGVDLPNLNSSSPQDVSFCFGGVSGVSGGVKGVLHLTSLYNANWLFTTLIIQK